MSAAPLLAVVADRPINPARAELRRLNAASASRAIDAAQEPVDKLMAAKSALEAAEAKHPALVCQLHLLVRPVRANLGGIIGHRAFDAWALRNPFD
jgi:hypothetical protein